MALVDRFRLACAVLSLLTCGGCAVTYVDGAPVHRGFGLVKVTPPASGPDAGAAKAVVVTTLGLALYADPTGSSGVALGYGRQTFLVIGHNGCVDLKAAGPCAELANHQHGGAR